MKGECELEGGRAWTRIEGAGGRERRAQLRWVGDITNMAVTVEDDSQTKELPTDRENGVKEYLMDIRIAITL